MSNLSEEEIIEILKNQISDYVIGDYCVKCGHNKICNDRNEDCNFIQAIDGILDLYNKEKEKNKELIKYKEYYEEVNKKFISKDKIREKIEEYNKMINGTYSDITFYGDFRRDVCIEIKNNLQEFLED